MGNKIKNTSSDKDLERIPYFDWDKTKFFYYVARLGSFSAAAEFFNIAQSAISRKISILEDHLKFPLFTRLPRGVELTRKGEELYQIIERTFVDLKGFAHNSSIEMNSNRERKIRIASTDAVASYILSDLIIKYNKSKPNIHFELIGSDHHLDVLINNIDLAIRPLDIRIKGKEKKTPRIKYEYLFGAEKKLFASNDYLKEKGEPQTVEDLRNHRLLAFGPNPEKHPYANINWMLGLGMPTGELNEPYFTSNSIEALIKAAKEGVGIIGSYEEFSILREAGLKNILPGVKCEALENYIIYPDYLIADKEVMSLKEYLKENLSDSAIHPSSS